MTQASYLFAERDPLRLAGARCASCAAVTFPAQDDCPRCATRSMEAVALPRVGRLWTWTVQTFAPRPPFVEPASGFEPFCLGYVDLGDVIVEARLDARPEELETGASMELVPWTWMDPDGTTDEGYAFAPAAGGLR